MKTLAPISALLLLVLAPVAWAAPVSIQVLGPDKKPVPGAQVRASFWKNTMGPGSVEAGDVQSAISDARGLARFESPQSTGPGWMDGMVGSAVAWSPALSISSSVLRLGQNTIALARSGTARGVVVDGAGQPLAGALVRLSGVTAPEANILTRGLPSIDPKMVSEEFVARSDNRGAWSLQGLPLLGSVAVDLGDDAFARTSASAPVVEDAAPWSADDSRRAARAKASAPAVPAPSSMRREASGDGILVARAGASISGRVLDVAGAPIEGATITLSLPGQEFFASTGEPVKSDARGEFRASRLGAGEHKVTIALDARDQARGVLSAPLKVTVAVGASASLGDIKLVPGGTVTIRLLDAATGQGIGGGRAFAVRGGILNSSPDFVMSPPSDASGKSVLHLSQGKYQIVLAALPQGYLRPEGAGYLGARVEALTGADRVVEWKLAKGLPLGGRVVDQAGQPVAGVYVWLRSAKSMDRNANVTSDAEGKWSVSSLAPGNWSITLQGDEWKLASPANVSLPRVGPLDIVLAPVARLPIGGRAVDGAGAPLGQARVDLKITLSGGIMLPSERSATTQADGTWRIETVPETASAITVAVSRAGYAPQRLPKASKIDGSWAATEAILQKRDARLAGRVLDDKGQAAPAQVLVASSQSIVGVDKQGAWSADDLPPGEVEVIAVSAGGSSVATTIAPNEGMTLRLKAPPTLAARDVERAGEVLEDAWQTSRGAQIGSRAFIPAVLAAADPDAALALARGDKKEVGRVVLEIVRVMLRQGAKGAKGAKGAEEAEAWVQANLGTVEEPSSRTSLFVALAEGLADTNPASASKWLGQARTSYAALKEDRSRSQLAAQMAALGARLKEADAEALFEQALKAASGSAGSSSYDSLAWDVAPQSEAWAVKTIEAAIVAAPTQPRYSQGPEAAAASAIRRMARTDLPSARRLLAKYGSLKSEYGGSEMDNARAEVLGARARAGEDVDALAREATDLPQPAQALALIADNAPAARKVELLQRALELARQSRLGMSDTLQVIRRLLPVDRPAARAALEKARLELEAPRDGADEWNRFRAADVAGWAWLYRGFDGAGARLLIEREWALGASALPGEQDEWNRWRKMSELVAAMMPLDIERAQQLAERLPVAGPNPTAFGAQRTIARWMLAEEKERWEKPLAFWSRDRQDDGRYSGDW